MGIPYSLFGSYSGLKRPRDDSDDEVEEVVKSPVRKKLKTAEYIYQQLFVVGDQSDVTICALGKEWHLHKVYLSQSQYFSSMFSGTWKESKQSKITLNIPNKLITTKSLDQVFGSLYRDEIEIDPNEVIPLLVTATLLQLDGLVAQCADVMSENINFKTAVKYHSAAEQNGLVDVRESCCFWLRRNLLTFSNHGILLKNISVKLMQNLISSNDFFVIQGEIDVYSMLKKWMFLRVNGYSKQTDGTLKTAADNYFASWKNNSRSFLESVRGRKFLPVFVSLKLCHILTSDKGVQTMFDDNIVPKSVIESVMALQWRMQLSMENTMDLRDDKVVLNEDEFYRRAIRCGRILPQDIPHCWRWSGFYFGVDVLLSYKQKVISIKRNCTSQTCPYSMNMKIDRIIFYKLNVVQFDKQRRITWSETTPLQKISLKADEIAVVLRIPNHVEFPLTVAFWYTVTPLDDKSKEIVASYDGVWNSCKYSTSVTDDETFDDDSETSVDVG